MRTLCTSLWILAALGACKSSGDRRTQYENEIDHLKGTNEALSRRLDRATSQRADLQRRVRELEAAREKGRKTDEVVKEVTAEIDSKVQELIERFQGDKDITVRSAPDGYRLILREKVLFGSGSADILEDGKLALQRVTEALAASEGEISVEGHTDDRPVKKPETLAKFPRGNIDLSVQRALAVWDYLVHEGKIEAARLAVAGYGPNRPLRPNEGEFNRWQNRRVEIRVRK